MLKKFLLALVFLPFLSFSETIYFAITPTTSGKLLSVVKEQINLLRKNHKLVLVPLSQLQGKSLNATVIVAGEEFGGEVNVKATKLILDFCHSCFHLGSLAKRSGLVVCSTSPLLWFGYGKLYRLKEINAESIKRAIGESYRPYAKRIRFWFGYVEVEIKAKFGTEKLRIR